MCVLLFIWTCYIMVILVIRAASDMMRIRYLRTQFCEAKNVMKVHVSFQLTHADCPYVNYVLHCSCD